MFLNVLNQEERTKCLELFYLVVNIDGNYAEEEQTLMENYKIELGFAEVPEIKDSLEELINYFSTKSESIRKMLYFEICGLVFADDSVAEEERELLDSIQMKFGIDKERLIQIEELVVELQTVYDRIYAALA